MAADLIPHKVIREARADGSVLLTSGYAMGSVARCTGDMLHHWAETTPYAVFLAERSGAGWRAVSYAEALGQVQALAAALLARGMGPATPILILSGNSVNHGLLSLAAHYIGVPTVPLAEQYALIPGAEPQLRHCVGVTRPAMVYAESAETFGRALGLDIFDGDEKLVSGPAAAGMTTFDDLLRGAEGGDLAQAFARVGPDTVAKYLMTSGSTSSPKAVITTQAMMCANQTQIADALPFLRARPPRIVDWLPWNHVFGGSHNFNMMLANGGALYIDAGKPAPGLVETSIENNRLQSGTIAFNVPVGFGILRDRMRKDHALRDSYFRDLDMLFYAGASLPQDIWSDLEDMAREVRGDVPLFTSSWGMTETAPACLIQHEPTSRSGIIGVPMTGMEIKLIPDAAEAGRYDLRVRGPNITPGYLGDAAKTAELFDEEGFLISGDAVRLVDENQPGLGMRFDGRMAEEFKLLTGTWVRAAALRMALLARLAPLAQDLVVCGADRAEIGLMIVPGSAAREAATEADGLLTGAALADDIRAQIGDQAGQGSAARVRRVVVLSEPLSIGEGEVTAKGNLNFARILKRRAALLERLYSDDDPAVIRL